MSVEFILTDVDGDTMTFEPGNEVVDVFVKSGECEWGFILSHPTQTRALFRYLAGIVLPTVERIDEVCCYVPKDATMFRNTVSGGGHACVLKGSGDVLYQGNLFAPEWIRGYASMLLAAADEADGGHQ